MRRRFVIGVLDSESFFNLVLDASKKLEADEGCKLLRGDCCKGAVLPNPVRWTLSLKDQPILASC